MVPVGSSDFATGINVRREVIEEIAHFIDLPVKRNFDFISIFVRRDGNDA